MREPHYSDAMLSAMVFVGGITGAELQELYPRLKEMAPHSRLKNMAKYAAELQHDIEFLKQFDEKIAHHAK